MAANLDKAESALTTVSDVAFVRAVDASGNSVKISKSDLASVLGVPNIIKASFYNLGNTGSVYTTDIRFNDKYFGKMVLAFMHSHAGVSVLYTIAYDPNDSSNPKVTTLAESPGSVASVFSFSFDADKFLVVTCNGGPGGNTMHVIYF